MHPSNGWRAGEARTRGLLALDGPPHPVVTEAVQVAIEPCEAAARLRGLPDLVLLESSLADRDAGRYSYVTADPFLTLRATGDQLTVRDRAGSRAITGNPWPLLGEMLARYRQQSLPGLPPFQGGAIGYFGYDLARHLERLPATAPDDLQQPDLALGFYDWVLAYDHALERAWLITTNLPDGSLATARERRAQLRELLAGAAPAAASLPAPPPRFRSNVGRAAYLAAVRQAQEYIRAGDIYQVNLSHRLDAEWQGDSWELYRQLRHVAPAPFAAYLAYGEQTIVSGSPELFLRVARGQIETRPIKGTRPRGATPEEDRRLAEELATSAKDRAENLMIVDLLRNDLGRVCRAGSVQAPRLFALEGYSTVWQLVSTVTGRLRGDLQPVDVLAATFPGGSVTGCPKIRAMEIIEELEPSRRGIYCGAIGAIGFTGSLTASIVIRTFVHQRGRLSLQVGGAVVADSDPAAEYEETLAKAAAGLRAAGGEIDPW